jgi:osmotically-inducible protein OsmY
MKSVHDAVGDVEVRERVLTELEWDPRIDPSHLRVRVEDGAVSLHGTVTTYSQRYAAVRAAERVGGVKAVADGIDVVLSRDTERSDAALAAEIARVRNSTTALPSTVGVEVRSGNLLLTGSVARADQRDAAARALRHLAGVRSIANAIVVRPV